MLIFNLVSLYAFSMHYIDKTLLCNNLPVMHILCHPPYVCIHLGEFSLCNLRVKFCVQFHAIYKGSQNLTLPCATNVFLFNV